MSVNLAIFAQQMTPMSPTRRHIALVGCGRPVDKDIADGLRGEGCEVRYVHCPTSPLAGDVDIFDTEALRRAVRGAEVVVSTIAYLSFRKVDAVAVWQFNVEGMKNLCLAAELEGVGRLVHLSSTLCLGHQTTSQAVDVDAPYFSNDSRTVLERSLFRGEMQAWMAAERGLKVTTICAGIDPEEILPMLERHARRWPRTLPPMHTAFTNSDDAGRAVVRAIGDDGTAGRRILCVTRNADLGTIANELLPEARFGTLSVGQTRLIKHLPEWIASVFLPGSVPLHLLIARDNYVVGDGGER